MKIDVSDIVKIDGASLDIEINESMEDLSSTDDDFVFDTPVSFSGHLVNISGTLKLEGHLKADYSVKCFRCLKDIQKHMDINIRENFISSEADSNGEAYTYEDNRIEIDKVLKDSIVLNLPMKQICSKECKGLCPRCGIDLNEKTCECKDDDIDPKMEALKNFFNN